MFWVERMRCFGGWGMWFGWIGGVFRGGEDVVWVGRCGLGGDDIETEEIYISRW